MHLTCFLFGAAEMSVEEPSEKTSLAAHICAGQAVA